MMKFHVIIWMNFEFYHSIFISSFSKWRLNWICRQCMLSVKAVTLLLTWMLLKRHIYCKGLMCIIYRNKEMWTSSWVCVGILPQLHTHLILSHIFWFLGNWINSFGIPLVHNGSGVITAGYRTWYPDGHLVQSHNVVG